jgi:hypothetical protein
MNRRKVSVLLIIVLVVLTTLFSSPEKIFPSSLPGFGHLYRLSSGASDWLDGIFDNRDSTKSRPGKDTMVIDQPKELTHETYDLLNNLPPPKPYGQFIMDGLVDTSATLLASHGGMNLYGAVRGSHLYVATNFAQSQRADMLIFVSLAPTSLRNAPWAKNGQVGISWKQ